MTRSSFAALVGALTVAACSAVDATTTSRDAATDAHVALADAEGPSDAAAGADAIAHDATPAADANAADAAGSDAGASADTAVVTDSAPACTFSGVPDLGETDCAPSASSFCPVGCPGFAYQCIHGNPGGDCVRIATTTGYCCPTARCTRYVGLDRFCPADAGMGSHVLCPEASDGGSAIAPPSSCSPYATQFVAGTVPFCCAP